MSIRTALCTVIMAALVSLVPADGHAKRRKGPPDVVQNALATAPSDRASAISMLEASLAGRKPGAESLEIMLHAGEQRRLNGDTEEARTWFAKVLEADATSEFAQSARLGQSLIKAANGQMGRRVMNTLNDASASDVLDTQNADRYLFLAMDAAAKDQSGKVSSYAKKSLQWAQSDRDLLQRIQSTLDTLAETPPDEVDPTLAEGPGGPLEKAIEAYIAGDFSSARRLAEKASKDNDPLMSERATGMLQTLDAAPVRRDLITVLLPLSDRYEAVGNNIREALSYGYGRGAARLQFVDSGSTAETAVAAMERAVLTDGAIAVVGPLLTDETEAVVQAAERLAVPLLSLSQAFETPEEGVWGFQAMYTRGDQVTALLDWAMGSMGMTDFAVFSPDNDFGHNAVDLFKAGVEERQGNIAAHGTYSAEEQNLLPFASEFGEREGDLDALRERARRNGGNPDTVVVPPVVNFQGLFLPENARRTPLACAALAYNEFPMGTFQPKRDSPEIPLLGLSTWNTKELVSTGNEYTRNSLFPDVFSSTVAGDDDPFVLAYQAATGRSPSALEAATVDAGRLLAAAVASNPGHRGAFRQALLEANVAESVTGASGFDPETLRAKRNMMILTITRSTLERVGEVPLYGAEPRVYEEPDPKQR
ncbi:MAG: penicillin-binding protein activator [Myxococcales bacterium]|nr:penicillin-binding protein activator [Myxococcales bacterium]